MHQAYAQFRDRGLVVLSLSFDNQPGDIAPFRKQRFPMPWLHTFVEGGFQSPLAKQFEVMGIPKPILVGADGTILATENALRGEQLTQTLSQHLPAR